MKILTATATISGEPDIELEPDCIYGIIDARIELLNKEADALEVQIEECNIAIRCLEAAILELEGLKESTRIGLS